MHTVRGQLAHDGAPDPVRATGDDGNHLPLEVHERSANFVSALVSREVSCTPKLNCKSVSYWRRHRASVSRGRGLLLAPKREAPECVNARRELRHDELSLVTSA